MLKKNLLNSPLGFTLIELLISIVIVVILSSIGIASFNSANAQNGVQQRAAEIRSLARKLRTDAGAAVKPKTGTDTNSSCKSWDTNPDKGIVYGSYINFTNNSQTYTYGIACYDSGNTWLGSTTSGSLPSGFKFYIDSNNPTIIFPFNGLAGSITASRPIVSDFSTVTMPANQYVRINDGSHDYFVFFNGNGLICEQRANSAPFCDN